MAKIYRTLITETAEIDLLEAYQWIETEALHSASNWVSGLIEAIASLETFPERCPIAPENDLFEKEIRVHLYRRSSVYRILFTIQVDQVIVRYIRHGAWQPITPE
jgi:hypothetical protein